MFSSDNPKALYRVQVGAYGAKENAQAMEGKLKKAGFDAAIVQAIDGILHANADKVLEYRSGKDKLFGFFVGQVMKSVKGVNPARVNELLKAKLQAD